MKYYHFIMAERSDKCYKAEVVFLRNLLEHDFEAYSRLESHFFDSFQELEGVELDTYFAESDQFFATVEAQQEQTPLHEEVVYTVVSRSRKSAMFSIAHKIAKAIRKEGDDYQVTFSACLKLVRQFI